MIFRIPETLLLAALAAGVQRANAFTSVVPSVASTRTATASATTILKSSVALDDDWEEDDDDDDEDDEFIDTDSLGDWRSFRRSLSSTLTEDADEVTTAVAKASSENQQLLAQQNQELAREYASGVWAHETSTPEVGGLLVRLPLEVEIFRNHELSVVGKNFRKKLSEKDDGTFFFGGGYTNSRNRMVEHTQDPNSLDLGVWYARAQKFIEKEMGRISKLSDDQGQIDSTSLPYDSGEMLTLFLDHQDTWQEVCLVLERNDDDSSKTIVLNRPMAKQMSEALCRLVLNGAFSYQSSVDPRKPQKYNNKEIMKFLLAFGSESAVYLGGPDGQEEPATLIHGYGNIPGSVEIGGTGIYQGGDMIDIVDGVLDGQYKALDFKFFVGHHAYDESALDVLVRVSKYQPVAAARSVGLKQCLGLPKPLWHEVLELCGGDLGDISSLEMIKKEDTPFQVVRGEDDDDDEEEGSDDDDFYMGEFDDDDDDDDIFYGRA